MQLSLVPVGQIHAAIAAVLPYLEVSAEWSQGRANVDDLLSFLLTGRMQLWAVHKDHMVHGHVITEIKQYPQLKMLNAQYCAMATGTMEQVNDTLHNTLQRYASDAGCAGVEFVGRPGWRAMARKHGYEPQAVIYQKFFEGPA